MPAAKLTSPGQLVIPKPVGQHLRLQPGDRVDCVIRDDGEVVVQPAGDVGPDVGKPLHFEVLQ